MKHKALVNSKLKLIIKLKCSLVIAFLFFFTAAKSQPQPVSDTNSKSYSLQLSNSYAVWNESFLAHLKERTSDKALLKHYTSRYKEFFKAVKDEINEGQMAYVPVLSGTLDKMLIELKSKNEIVPKDMRIIMVRANEPNAHTIGDNVVFINMGVFYCLENEGQVASILAHEIGHCLLDHSIKALNYSYEKDKENVEGVKAVKQIEVHKTDRAFDLVKDQIYKGGKLRKAHELQADSIGYILFRNTAYDKKDFVKALSIAGQYDTLSPGNVAVETYRQFFDLPEQKFQESWLKAEDFSQYNYKAFTEKFDKDSVASHPSIEERIKNLTRIFPELAQAADDVAPKAAGSANALQIAADKERLKNLYVNEQYGAAMYLALQCLQENPADSLARKWLGKNLRKIYHARKDYQLNKYLERISPKDQSESYMRFLSFMWNLKLNEIKMMAEYYTGKKLSPEDQ